MAGKGHHIWRNRYEFICKLGEGGESNVFKVRDLKDNDQRTCYKALKAMTYKVVDDDEFEVDEVTIQRQLDHVHVVKMLDVFRDNEQVCIVSELCNEGDLKSKIKHAKTPFDEKTICEWLLQIVKGVSYLHKVRILHRDLKPHNILLNNGVLKICDFGVSRVIIDALDNATTEMIGTPHYQAPERFKHCEYDFKVDTWAIGCILYQMAERKFAFNGNYPEIKEAVLSGSIPIISDNYSLRLRDLQKRLMRTDPSERPSNEEIILELEQILSNQAQKARGRESTIENIEEHHQIDELEDRTDTLKPQDTGTVVVKIPRRKNVVGASPSSKSDQSKHEDNLLQNFQKTPKKKSIKTMNLNQTM